MKEQRWKEINDEYTKLEKEYRICLGKKRNLEKELAKLTSEAKELTGIEPVNRR